MFAWHTEAAGVAGELLRLLPVPCQQACSQAFLPSYLLAFTLLPILSIYHFLQIRLLVLNFAQNIANSTFLFSDSRIVKRS